MSNLKQLLYLQCCDYIANHESEIRRAIADAQEAANNEEKSSAGDKFETGRETMQQEIDLNLTRLGELDKQKHLFDHVLPDHTSATVQPGSVVHTNNGKYYVSIGAGKLRIEDTVYYAVSPVSPIGTKMSGLKTGDTFELNGRTYVIECVI